MSLAAGRTFPKKIPRSHPRFPPLPGIFPVPSGSEIKFFSTAVRHPVVPSTGHLPSSVNAPCVIGVVLTFPGTASPHTMTAGESAFSARAARGRRVDLELAQSTNHVVVEGCWRREKHTTAFRGHVTKRALVFSFTGPEYDVECRHRLFQDIAFASLRAIDGVAKDISVRCDYYPMSVALMKNVLGPSCDLADGVEYMFGLVTSVQTNPFDLNMYTIH